MHPQGGNRLRGTEIVRINLDYDISAFNTIFRHCCRTNNTFLLTALPLPCYFNTGIMEGVFYKLPHRMAFTGADHVIVRFFLLKHEPLAHHVFRRKPPISLCIKVADIELFCFPDKICATARVIFRVTKVSPLRGLS